MGDDEEVMGFHITDQDMEESLRPGGYRRRKMSKKHSIYGVFADNTDSEEETDRPSFSSRTRKDYSAPVNFVSGGVQNQKKDKDNEKEAEEVSDASSDEGGGGGRRGFGGGGLGSRSRAGRVESEGQIAGLRTQSYAQPQSLGKGFGDWEKHTKGIGAKLLLNMGFQPGKGLGKNLQGRNTIVEAYLRKGKGAIGAYGHEGGRPKGKKDSDEEEEKEYKEKLNQWKTGTAVGGKKKNVSYVYKTVDDVIAESQFRKVDTMSGERRKGEGVKVIDMTGREQRVLTGYSSIAGQQRPDEEGESVTPLAGLQQKRKKNFELPELIHNLNLLVDMTEQDIISADRKLAHHKDRVEVLQSEGERLADLVEREKLQIDAMEEVISVLDTLEEKHNAGHLDNEIAVRAFTRLKEEFPKEFREFELSQCAGTVVIPLVKSSLAEWKDPLAGRNSSLPHLTTFTQWREVLDLGERHSVDSSSPMPAYDSLVWECWVPHVRLAVQRWHSRDSQPLVSFLELWRPLLPGWVVQHVHERLVLARLQAEVELWDPLTDRTPLHTWLHPWLPALGARLEVVYPTIRNKLASALAAWHPADRSAKLILLPWSDVFSRAAMLAFLTKNIVPKLESCLSTLQISPRSQDMSVWHSVMDWSDLLPPPQLAQMLAQSFFPRWLQVLAGWLNSNPNYEEVVGWYQGWKSSVPGCVLSLPGVADHLSQALHMMNRSVSGGGPLAGQPGALENVMYMTNLEMQGQPRKAPEAGLSSMSETVKTAAQIPQGFKDLIGRRCEEKGLVFRPLPGRLREGKQMYLVGSRQVYLDRNVIFVMELGTGVWVPTSLNSLIDGAS